MEIEFTSDKTGSEEKMAGSDKRANVSSRSDSRRYYNSRDSSLSFSFALEDASIDVGEYLCYVKNNSTEFDMVLNASGINSQENSGWEFNRVSGTCTGGGDGTLVGLNSGGKAVVAPVTARLPSNSTSSPLAGLTDVETYDKLLLQAYGHEEFRFDDSIRIGQGQAVAIKKTRGTADNFAVGVVFVMFEVPKK